MIRCQMVRPALLVCLALGLAGAGPAAADEPGSATTVDAVETCVRDNLPDDSSIQTIIMTSRDRVGAETRLEAKIYWQKNKGKKDGFSKALLQFSDPPDMRDSTLLVIELEGDNDMFMYLPDLGKARRVTTHMMAGSMFGTDFSYEDFERIQGMAEDASSELLADSSVDGRNTWVVASIPREDQNSGYEKVVSYVDKEKCVALKVEFFEKGGKLRKLLEVDVGKITLEGGIHVPTAVSMTDLRDDTTTVLLVNEIDMHAKISRSRFSQRRLETGR